MRHRLQIFLLCILPGLHLNAGPWIDLFDGESLDGWVQLNGKAPYTVQHGCIIGTTVADTPNSFLCTEKDYGDFILEFDVLQEGISNSGVQFRSISTQDYKDGRVHGYQCEIDPSARSWTGGIYDEARRGWIARPEHNPWTKSVYQLGRWNHFRIEAIGDQIRTWVNGLPVVHLIDDMTASGFIALQVHSIGNDGIPGSRIAWKNIRIQTEDLCPSPTDPSLFIRNRIPNNLSEAEKSLGWTLLWDGKTTRGWRAVGSAAFPVGSWKIEDGQLILPARDDRPNKEPASIVTGQSFRAFELQFDFKLSEGGNSGVKYFITEDSEGAYGLEYQLLDNKRHADATKGVAGNRTLASLYDLIPSRSQVSTQNIPTNVQYWHQGRIVVRRDNTVEHWIDGFKVVEFEHGSPLFQALVARSKYAKYENFSMVESSPILLQDHGDAVRFRSLKIRRLD